MLLDEAVYQSLPESKKALYLHQWLQGLPQVISDTPKAELKDKQKLLVGQLQAQLNAALGPPLRTALAQAFVTLYSMGDTFSLHDTIGKCCDIIRAREDVGVSSTNKLRSVRAPCTPSTCGDACLLDHLLTGVVVFGNKCLYLASSPSTSPLPHPPLPIHLASSSSTSPLPHPPRLFPIHLASSHPPCLFPIHLASSPSTSLSPSTLPLTIHLTSSHPPCLFPIHLASPHPPRLSPSTLPLPHPPRLFPIHLASYHPPRLSPSTSPLPIHLTSSPSTSPLPIHLASSPSTSPLPIHLASYHPPHLFPITSSSPTSPLPHPPHLFPIHLTSYHPPRLFPIHLTSYHPPCLFPIHPTSFPPILPLPHPPRLLLLNAPHNKGGAEKHVYCHMRGALFEHHGRMAGSLFLETMQLFLKALKVQEYRAEILNAMGCVVVGLGTSSSSVQKEIYKSIRTGLGDKSMLVRSAAAKCGIQLAKCSTFLYSQELDAISNSCLKALEGSNYEVRCSVAAFLGTLVSLTQKPLPPSLKGKLKLPSLEEALLILSNGFIRGASMFMKAGGADLLKTGTASREVRVGITQDEAVLRQSCEC
eukprot:Em0019g722a